MTRLFLSFLLAMFVGRAIWRLLNGIVEGVASSDRRGGPPARGVAMVRDPVCGTFVVPSRALTASDGDHVQYFCSEECRRRFRLR